MVKFARRLTAPILFLALCFPGNASAQQGFSLAQLEEMLWGSNQSVEAAFQRLKAALYEQEEAKLFSTPRIAIGSSVYPSGRTTAGGASLYHSRRTTTGKPRVNTATISNVEIYYPIIKSSIGRYYKKLEKKSKAEELEGELKLAKNEVLFALRQRYFRALGAQQVAQVYGKGSLALKETLRETRRLYRQKRLLLSDVLLAEKKVLQLRQNMARQQDDYLEQKADLAVLLGMEEEELLLAPQPSLGLPSLPKLPNLITLAFGNNPLLQILKARKEKEDSLAKKASWDNVNLQLVSGYTLGQQHKYGTAQDSYFGLNISFPLNNWQITSLRRQQALSRKKSWGAEIKLAKRQLKGQLQVAYKKAKGLQAEYQLLEKQRQEAQARRQQIKRRRQYSSTGKIDYRQLIQAEQDFWEAEAQLSRKNWERFIAFYHILYLTGYNKALPAAFFPPGPSELEFVSSKLCLRTLLVQDSSFLSSTAERDFFLFFCQTKGVGRVLLSAASLAEEEELAEFINKLAEHKIGTYLHLNAAYPEAVHDAIQELVSFNERNVWQANWRGIYLTADFEQLVSVPLRPNKGDLPHQVQQVRKLLADSAQELRLILQISLDYPQLKPDFWRPIIEAADELAFQLPEEEKLPPALQALLRKSDKSHWWVLGTKDFTDEGEQGLEAKIRQVAKEDARSLGVVLDNYNQYRYLITH